VKRKVSEAGSKIKDKAEGVYQDTKRAASRATNKVEEEHE